MLIAEPPRTQFDLNFRVAGFHVRVHPFFWLMTLLLGARDGDPLGLLIWAGVVFTSILVHELGHAFAMRHFGQDARIVLYLMGGLAIPESSAWGGGRRSRGTWEQILISAAGPGAGFLLAALVAALVFVAGGAVHIVLAQGFLPIPFAVLPDTATDPWREAASGLLWVNIFWGLLNLLPVLPLDGGQIARELLCAHDPWQGMVRALTLSVAVGGAIAAFGLLALHERFLGILFGMLAFSNFMALRNMRGQSW